MKYVIMSYLLGIGFIIGLLAGEIIGSEKIEHAKKSAPYSKVEIILFSPVIAIIWVAYLFFTEKGE